MAWLPAMLAHPGMAPAAAEQARTVRVALGETKAPYVFSQEQRGVEVELIAAILKDAGYQAQMLYLPNKRAQLMLGVGAVDAAISPRGGFLSAPYIVYQNLAITLCDSHLAPRSVASLSGLRVAAFQNAHLFLGNDFMAMAAANKEYREPPQASINRLLFARRIDVGISDINVFKAINDKLNDEFGKESNTLPAWCAHALFAPTRYRLAFREREVRDRFDHALRRALNGNLYESIGKRYRLPSVDGHPYFKPAPTVGGRP